MGNFVRLGRIAEAVTGKWAAKRTAFAKAAALTSFVCLGLTGGHASAADLDDGLSLLMTEADSVAAVQMISEAGAETPAAFRMVEILREAETFEVSDGVTLEGRITSYEMQADCKNDRLRIVSITALGENLQPTRTEQIDSEWVEVYYPNSRVTTFACGSAEKKAQLEKRRFADLASLAPAALDIMDAKKSADAAHQAAASSSASSSAGMEPTLDGISVSDCATPAGRAAAAHRVSPDKVRYAGNMNDAMLKEASLASVQESCALWVILSREDPFEKPELIPMRYWYALDFADCQAAWNGSCERAFNIEIPKGFQMCRADFQQDGRGDKAEILVTPEGWLPGGGQTPRFTKYRILLHSDGGYHILDKQSANIKIQDL
ncbi:MAG: hypothetical protein H0W74_03765 [Sphingosinicella sp.]|nr:hypothetical protein [Sphingosinicella sp.]